MTVHKYGYSWASPTGTTGYGARRVCDGTLVAAWGDVVDPAVATWFWGEVSCVECLAKRPPEPGSRPPAPPPPPYRDLARHARAQAAAVARMDPALLAGMDLAALLREFRQLVLTYAACLDVLAELDRSDGGDEPDLTLTLVAGQPRKERP